MWSLKTFQHLLLNCLMHNKPKSNNVLDILLKAVIIMLFSCECDSERIVYNKLFFIPLFQVSYLEKKITELENDSLANGDLKSKLKQENTQLVHR